MSLVGAATLGLAGLLPAANTPGRATFSVLTRTYGGQYAPRHVLAIWVADANTNFVETLERRAGTRQQYLYKWLAARGTWTGVDGISGATLTAHTTHNVTWDCKNTNGVVVPDGTYRFMVEFTEANAQGPWTTNSIPFVKGPDPYTNAPTDLKDFISMSVSFAPASHDVAALRLTPSIGNPDTTVNLRVLVTNLTDYIETFTVTVSNLTSASLVGTQQVSLAGGLSSSVLVPWNTAGLPPGNYLLQAIAGPLPQEVFTADNVVTNLVTLRLPVHDVRVAQVTPPVMGVINLSSNLTVVVTNIGDFTETFGLTLFDATDQRLLASNYVTSLASFAGRTLTLPWAVGSSSVGYHRLEALAGPVAGEASIDDNTLAVTVPVASGVVSSILVASNSFWRYNDTGTDLSRSAWDETIFYDGFWSAGQAPLGYGQTNLNTTVSYGTNANNKYPCYYFRKTFYVDILPVSSLTLKLRRDDGCVLYLNGHEALRTNMPTGPITYSTWANATVSGADQYTYFVHTVPATNLIIGENLVAVEVHQVNATSSDISFDIELSGQRPNFPLVHNVAATQVVPAGDAVAGDWVTVSVTLTNQGNVTETFTVYLRDINSGQVVGWQTVTNLVPKTATQASVTWKTLGAAVGPHTLQAFTVVNGVTNLIGSATTVALVSSSGLGLNAVNAAGALAGRAAAVAVTDDLLLVGAGASLEVLDRSAAYTPVRLGAVRLPGLIEDVAVAGSFAYAACGGAGVQIVDLSNPRAPLHRNSFNSSGHAYQLEVVGRRLFLADGRGGVRVLSISNAAAPTLVGAYYTEGPARALAVAGSFAYVLDQHKGLKVLDVSNPAAITPRGSHEGFDAGQALAVAGGLAYVVDGNGYFRVLSVVNPAAPAPVGSLLLNAVGQSIALDGPLAHVAAGDAGVLSIDASDPSRPALLASQATPGQASDVALAFSLAYVADGFAGLRLVDLYWPDEPMLIADLDLALRGADVALAGGRAYVAAGEGGLRVFDVSQPAAPQLLGVCQSVSNARCVAVSATLASLAFVGDGQYGLKIVNVATPSLPVLLATYAPTNLGSVRSVAAEGNRVAFTDGRQIVLLDASVPASPAWVGSYPAPAFAYALAMANGRVYAACGTYGLLVLNAASGLSFAGSYNTPGLASAVSISGTRAHVADGQAGWLTLDVSGAGSPTLVQASRAEGPVTELAAAGALVAVANPAKFVRSVDVSVPLTPVPQQAFGPLTRALRVALAGQFAYAAEDEAGLAVLDLSQTDLDHDGLPDGWEQQIVEADPYDLIRTVNDVFPNGDFDGDGLPNYQEYLAGTSPIDAASVFFLAVQADGPGATATLRWTSVAGKTYTIYKTPNLQTPFQVLLDNVTATPPVNQHTDPVGGDTAFYLISVR